MRPIGGRWNPRADFEETVLAHDPSITNDRFAAAIVAGDRFFAGLSSTPDYDDYHRVVLRNLGIEATPQLLADLRREVPVDRVLELYPDVRKTLEELSQRQVRMAVVSDAWPDLPGLHAALGIHHFFEAYAISAELGCRGESSAGGGLGPPGRGRSAPGVLRASRCGRAARPRQRDLDR
ncbi:HAD family hydrolase [Streptomyces sp. NPDC056231]|uniref:HAD family hydrolase n=1 Tax=Streptomyces sp. NPDC056231 TaxID=3345755 RepID=UPI003AAACD4B